MKSSARTIRNILLSLICIVCGINSYAQLSHTSIGIKGGMNISKLSVSGLSDESNRIGYHFGAFVRLGLSESFALQPEMLFATKGAVLNYKNVVAGGAVVSLKYVDVPMLGVIYLTKKINLHVGPYFSYLIDASAQNESGEQSDIANQIDRHNFKSFDYGAVGGLGMEFRALNLGVRYLQGLQNIGQEKEFNGQPDYNFPDGKNSAWQIYLGIALL